MNWQTGATDIVLGGAALAATSRWVLVPAARLFNALRSHVEDLKLLHQISSNTEKLSLALSQLSALTARTEAVEERLGVLEQATGNLKSGADDTNTRVRELHEAILPAYQSMQDQVTDLATRIGHLEERIDRLAEMRPPPRRPRTRPNEGGIQ